MVALTFERQQKKFEHLIKFNMFVLQPQRVGPRSRDRQACSCKIVYSNKKAPQVKRKQQ